MVPNADSNDISYRKTRIVFRRRLKKRKINMFFHKKDVMIAILFSFISLTLITAADRNENSSTSGYRPSQYFTESESTAFQSASGSPEYQSASGSPDYQSAFETPEHHSASESEEYYSATYEESDKESTNDYYIGISSKCWKKMQAYCEKRYPTAIDFARSAIIKSTEIDTDFIHYMQRYYKSFSRFLDAEGILSPDAYCLAFAADGEYDQNRDDKIKECRSVLGKFGNTNDDALQYGFYKTKVNPTEDKLEVNPKDSDNSSRFVVFMNEMEDYREKYLIHMANNVKLHGKMKSPLDICKKYNAQMKTKGKNISRNT